MAWFEKFVSSEIKPFDFTSALCCIVFNCPNRLKQIQFHSLLKTMWVTCSFAFSCNSLKQMSPQSLFGVRRSLRTWVPGLLSRRDLRSSWPAGWAAFHIIQCKALWFGNELLLLNSPDCLLCPSQLRLVSRPALPAPAVGIGTLHQQQQEAILTATFS